jgi:phospholipase/lecithinase/hemolysin
MKKFKHTFVVIALVVSLVVSGVPARADDPTDAAKIMNSVGMLTYALVSPALAYPLALNEDVWDFLVDSLCPAISSVEEQLRQVALHSAPTLKPTATAPHPELVDNKYLVNGYTQVISFGDSMSDNGNMFKVGMDLAGWGLPMPPNDNGRFSNGPVVIEIMSYILNRPLLNYAFGGAKSDYHGMLPAYGFDIGMLKEVDDYIGNIGWRPADSKALYVIWTGPDDFYKGVNIFNAKVASAVTNNINSAMTKLYKKGARNFFIPLMPDLSITPAARVHDTLTDGYLEAAHQRSDELATALTSMLKSFAKQYPLAKVRTFDTFTYSQVELQKYADLGYNLTDPCYDPPYMGLPGPVCDNPDEHLFWDMNHPTAKGSSIIGDAFASAAVGTPLPSR